jgi:hypothetical protein
MSTTIVNSPPANTQPSNPPSSSGVGFLLGTLILVIVGGLFYFYALPSIRQLMDNGVQVNVDLPSEVNVNVEQSEITQ